jgi:hypothetical protein
MQTGMVSLDGSDRDSIVVGVSSGSRWRPVRDRFIPTSPRRPPCYDCAVKTSDDYHAKVRLWARQPTVVAPPPGPPVPKFAAQRFRSHEEMNRWKQALLRELARAAARHG